MTGFFSMLADQGLYQDWSETLDWLLDNAHFPKGRGWTQ